MYEISGIDDQQTKIIRTKILIVVFGVLKITKSILIR